MRKDRRTPPPMAAPRAGHTYIVGRRMAVVLSVGDRPWREEVSAERHWTVEVLTDGGVETWAWGEYSRDRWNELGRVKYSGKLPNSSAGRGGSEPEARPPRPRQRGRRRGREREEGGEV